MDITLAKAAALLLGFIACACDLRTRRIPNALTLGGAAMAVAVSPVLGGPAGLAFSLAGWAVGLAVFLPFFLVRGMGAGDVKLMAALGAWVGPLAIAYAAVYAAIAGGLLAIGLSLYHGYLRQAFTNLGSAMTYWRAAGPGPVPNLTLATAKGPRLPYALPIFIGMVAALWTR